MIEVYLLGTGGMKPLPERALTGLWAEHEGEALLIDCGEGMQVSAARSGRSLAKMDSLLITHFHADHIAGLPGLLLSAGNYGKTSPLHIYAPVGGEYFIGGLMRICPEVMFDVIIYELSEEGGTLAAAGLRVEYFPVRHRVPCFGYNIIEDRLPVFDPKKAEALGVPVRYYKALHRGESIELEGRVITTEDVCAKKRAPLKISYITDTAYFDGLSDFAENADLLVCEGMYGSDEYIPKMAEKHHMVFSQSAEVARKAKAGELWLTHYSPALEDPAEYSEMMKGLFANTVISTDGISRIIK